MKYKKDLLKVLVFILILYGGCQSYTSIYHKTDKWNLEPKYGEKLMIRYTQIQDEAINTKRILLRYTQSRVVYDFDTETNILSETDLEYWNSMRSEIADCSQSDIPDPNLIKIKLPEKVLLVKENKLDTAGKFVLGLTKSVSGKKVAVLSNTQLNDNSFIPFFGKAGGDGIYYHQIFDMEKLKFVGYPLEIATPAQHVDMAGCWTTDEKNIIYYDTFFSFFMLISLTE